MIRESEGKNSVEWVYVGHTNGARPTTARSNPYRLVKNRLKSVKFRRVNAEF
jgi:hypothetical protein